jgi:hypothetical protein
VPNLALWDQERRASAPLAAGLPLRSGWRPGYGLLVPHDLGAFARDEDETSAHRRTVEIPSGLSLAGPDVEHEGQMLLALGSVVRCASSAEFLVLQLYRTLTNDRIKGASASAKPISRLLSDCRSAAGERDLNPQAEAKLDQWLEAMGRLMEHRNRVVHDVWMTDVDATPILVRTPNREFDFTSMRIDVNDLVGLAQALQAITANLAHWLINNLVEDQPH